MVDKPDGNPRAVIDQGRDGLKLFGSIQIEPLVGWARRRSNWTVAPLMPTDAGFAATVGRRSSGSCRGHGIENRRIDSNERVGTHRTTFKNRNYDRREQTSCRQPARLGCRLLPTLASTPCLFPESH